MARLAAALLATSAALAPIACSSSAPSGAEGSDVDVRAADAPDADAEGGSLPPHAFPEDFLFGTATAGFQVDMGCPSLPPASCRDTSSDWYAFVTSEAIRSSQRAHVAGDPVSLQAGFWETYEADLDRAADELHHDAFRMSLEWSRIFPEPTDDVEGYEALAEHADAEAVAHYHDILAAVRERGMEPLVTLNHYTLPSWLHDAVGCHEDLDGCDRRGWLDRERAVREIAKYARFAAREFGGQVDRWATLNEPMAVVLPGYLQPSERRTNPPAVSVRSEAARTALLAMIEAHARMYDAVEDADDADADGDGDPARTGLVYNVTLAHPKDPDAELDQRAAERVSHLFNRVFLDAVVHGRLDDDLDGEAEEAPGLGDRMDYLGLNHYAETYVEGTETAILPDLSPLTTFDPLSLELDFGRPEALYDAVTHVEAEWGVPVVVTENGTTVDPSAEGDASPYIVRHLEQLSRAIRDGVDVRGYFYWSLLDTYEWNKGMDVRMGLYGFDPDDPDKTRFQRPGAETYGTIAREHAIPEPLREAYLD